MATGRRAKSLAQMNIQWLEKLSNAVQVGYQPTAAEAERLRDLVADILDVLPLPQCERDDCRMKGQPHRHRHGLRTH